MHVSDESSSHVQCRQCRNINYEHPDAFVCNECGHSRFARFDFSITAAPALTYPPIRSPEDRAAALSALHAASESAHKKQTTLADLHRWGVQAGKLWGASSS